MEQRIVIADSTLERGVAA